MHLSAPAEFANHMLATGRRAEENSGMTLSAYLGGGRFVAPPGEAFPPKIGGFSLKIDYIIRTRCSTIFQNNMNYNDRLRYAYGITLQF